MEQTFKQTDCRTSKTTGITTRVFTLERFELTIRSLDQNLLYPAELKITDQPGLIPQVQINESKQGTVMFPPGIYFENLGDMIDLLESLRQVCDTAIKTVIKMENEVRKS